MLLERDQQLEKSARIDRAHRDSPGLDTEMKLARQRSAAEGGRGGCRVVGDGKGKEIAQPVACDAKSNLASGAHARRTSARVRELEVRSKGDEDT
jgi:hypothetical protein